MHVSQPTGGLTRPVLFLALAAFGLGSCSDAPSATQPDLAIPGASFNTARLTDLGLEIEQLYLSDSKASDDGQSDIFAVELDAGQANLTLVATIPFNQVDALAASPDGRLLYAVDRNARTLGILDLNTATFVDRGLVTGIPTDAQVVLAATDPDGNLVVAGQGNDTFYRIDNVETGTPTAVSLGSVPGLNLNGADFAYDGGGTLFVYTNAGSQLYTVDLDAGTATPVTTALPGGLTGMAIRANGQGDFVFSAGDGATTGNQSTIFTVPPPGTGTPNAFPMYLGENLYDYTYGDMTVGRLNLGCTSTQGYWGTKKHKDRWIPDTGQNPDEVFMGGYFGDETWFEVLRTPVRGDADRILARQFIAAWLNQLSGTFVPDHVQAALDRAYDLFTGGTPYASRDEKTADADLLASYNEGWEGVPSCDTALTVWACPAVAASTAEGSTGQVTVLGSPLDDVRSLANPSADVQVFAEYVGYDHGGIPFDITADNTAVLDGSAGVANGIPMCSYYVHYENGDPAENGTVTGSLTFGNEIEGLIVAGTINKGDIFYPTAYNNTVCDTDPILGNAATIYPAPATCGVEGDARGLEILRPDPTDTNSQDPLFIVQPDRRTLDFTLRIFEKHDSFRIILNPVEAN